MGSQRPINKLKYIRVKFLQWVIFLVLTGLPISLIAQKIPVIKPNTAYKSGEQLVYQLRYGIIVGATGKIILQENVNEDKLVYHAKGMIQTNGMADKLYGVRDVYESHFDRNTGLPYKSSRSIKEGRYKMTEVVLHNQQNNSIASSRKGLHLVPDKTLDMASTLYQLRRVDYSQYSPGDTLYFPIWFDDKVFNLRLRYKGKETIETKWGMIRCLKWHPIVEVDSFFSTPDDLTIWVTDDSNLIPILARVEIRVIGSVYCELIEYKNLRNSITFVPVK